MGRMESDRDEGCPPLMVAIDDDESVLRAVREVLTAAGYAVETATEWHEGYRLIKSRQPNVVIVDLLFEGDPLGWQLLQALVLDTKAWRGPIIVASGARDALREHGDRLTAMGLRVLPKPFGANELLDVVREAVGTAA